ncbi:MAG: sugar phosphate isomerase/epimerase [Ktedonobacteraceae bacterium]|nr:sugar phosphate isomerase/epimerase [Ktedonobacteraceae bacterium]
MRLSIVTDEIAQDLAHALHVCRDLGVDTVELRTVGGKNIVFHDDESLQAIKSLLEHMGIRVCNIASPFLKSHFWGELPAGISTIVAEPYGDFDTQENQWAILDRSCSIAHLLGAPMVRAFSFWRLSDPTVIREDLRAIFAEAVRRTEAAGLKLVLENEHACNLATGEEAGWLFEQIPSPVFGATWDPANAAALGAEPFPQGYRYVRGRVLHLHVKDIDSDGHFVKMGTGVIDYTGQLRALVEDGYSGLISLETHYQYPAQEGGAERATRESFAILQTLYRQATDHSM